LSAAELAAPQTANWMFGTPFVRGDYCIATQAESFGKAQSGALTMLVRKASFGDHILVGGTASAVVTTPHAKAVLAPKC
jgi:hypothetical protein